MKEVSEPTPPRSAPRTALIAEDDERVARMLGDTLRCVGITAHVVLDGAQAMRDILDLKPDVIVLDLILPRMHAQEICALIRRDPTVQHTPIIIISGWARSEDQATVFRMGADDFIVKPFHPDQLLASIETIFKRSPDDVRITVQE